MVDFRSVLIKSQKHEQLGHVTYTIYQIVEDKTITSRSPDSMF